MVTSACCLSSTALTVTSPPALPVGIKVVCEPAPGLMLARSPRSTLQPTFTATSPRNAFTATLGNAAPASPVPTTSPPPSSPLAPPEASPSWPLPASKGSGGVLMAGLLPHAIEKPAEETSTAQSSDERTIRLVCKGGRLCQKPNGVRCHNR